MKRILAAIMLLSALITGFGAPANAGTLTGATLTTNGSGYAVAGASNTRYDWRFTTATSNSSVSRIEGTVPPGTQFSGQRFLSLDGSDGTIATPSTAAFNSSTTFDIKVKARLASWTSGAALLSKYVHDGSGGALEFGINAPGKLVIWNTPTGGSPSGNLLSNQLTFAPYSTNWVRVVFQLNNGSGSRQADFYTSTDGVNWTQLGTSVTGTGLTAMNSNASQIAVGRSSDQVNPTKGSFYFASVANTVAGTTSSPTTCASTSVITCFDANDWAGGTSVTSSSAQHETWTINRVGYLDADIATDLAVAEIANLPSGGQASYRYIDNRIVYVFPALTTINAGTSILLALSGFTNPSAGSYTTLIGTKDNISGTIDFATTSALVFTDMISSATVGVAVDPSFAFTIAPHSGACNGVSQSAGVSSSSSSVVLGHVTAGVPAVAAQDFTVGTNANGGFNIVVKSSSLTSGSNTIAGAPGTNATPVAFPATTTAAYGYTVSGLSRFASAWAGPEAGNQSVMSASSVGNVTNCIAYKVQVTANTPAGTYSATAVYTAVPNF